MRCGVRCVIPCSHIKAPDTEWVFLFLAFMIIGGFFIMNLFVGVIIDNFNRLKETMGDSALLTPQQREWVKTRELMLHVRAVKLAEKPRFFWRLLAWRITTVSARISCRIHGSQSLGAICF